ncbi:hypothetical protein F5B21DRAFT_510186 [Xylaria acuta]|nr:hypothetical protein F5B21DRAFT_510186 [Xylaria acuta]
MEFRGILGLGIGMNLSTATLLTSLNTEFQVYAKSIIAQGLVAQMRIFGGSLGVAASFMVLNSRIAKTLTDVLTPDETQDFYRSPIVTCSFNLSKQLSFRTTYLSMPSKLTCTYLLLEARLRA